MPHVFLVPSRSTRAVFFTYSGFPFPFLSSNIITVRILPWPVEFGFGVFGRTFLPARPILYWNVQSLWRVWHQHIEDIVKCGVKPTRRLCCNKEAPSISSVVILPNSFHPFTFECQGVCQSDRDHHPNCLYKLPHFVIRTEVACLACRMLQTDWPGDDGRLVSVVPRQGHVRVFFYFSAWWHRF